MNTIGFFEGTDHALPGSIGIASIRGMLQLKSESDKQEIVDYLRDAPVAVRSLGTVSLDVLNPDKPEIGPHEIQSDGDWAWPNDLAFYVDKYDVGLDPAFINHALDRKHPPEALTAEQVRDVEHALFG